ncbi:hypothetical protein BDR06DRAFT_956649 [Suillus hirtellus]|nr:hypothetical protein BDR06DRAFT_956649 [Suillus hirtellus]
MVVVNHRSQPKYNSRAVNEYNVKCIPIPVRDSASDPRFIAVHSFDVTKPGAEVDELKSGVLASQTSYELGQEIKSHLAKDTQGQNRIFSGTVSLHAENNHLQFQEG